MIPRNRQCPQTPTIRYNLDKLNFFFLSSRRIATLVALDSYHRHSAMTHMSLFTFKTKHRARKYRDAA